MKTTPALILLSAVLSGLLSACLPAPAATVTPPPTAAPLPTATALPTATPLPTATSLPPSTATPNFTRSAQFVSAAWLAFVANDFVRARSLAQECVDRWESEAVRQQAALTQAPPTGAVSETDKNAILANWALNDVATAYDIIGQSAEKQGEMTAAKAAYTKAVAFPYGRAWDPNLNSFWAPADQARDALARLGG